MITGIEDELYDETMLATRGIDKAIPIPYYYQIAEDLRELIRDIDVDAADGEIALPPEVKLCEIYDVTRGTVRHALNLLEREGLIYRERGRGTFVTRRRVELDLTELCSTTEHLENRGWKPGVRVLSMESLAPRRHIQHALDLATGEEVWEIHRLRLADGEPISLEWAYLPCERAPRLDEHDLSTSLYYLLENECNLRLATADQTIRARLATLEEKELLQIPGDSAVFAIERTTYDENGEPLEYLHSVWRGDRYDFEVRLSRQ